MDQGLAALGPPISDDLAEAYRDALNLAPGQLHPALPMQVASTGLPYLIVPVQCGLDRARISHPDFEGLLEASGASSSMCWTPIARRAVPGTTPAGGRRRDRQRGRPPVTLLLHHGVHPAGQPLLIHQGQFTGRPSTIEVRPGPDGRLWVGGPVAPVAAGRFTPT